MGAGSAAYYPYTNNKLIFLYATRSMQKNKFNYRRLCALTKWYDIVLWELIKLVVSSRQARSMQNKITQTVIFLAGGRRHAAACPHKRSLVVESDLFNLQLFR